MLRVKFIYFRTFCLYFVRITCRNSASAIPFLTINKGILKDTNGLFYMLYFYDLLSEWYRSPYKIHFHGVSDQAFSS